MKKEQLASEIKSAVEWLIENDMGCSTIKLDNRLAVCVGWSDGYNAEDDSVIHSKSNPTWCVNAGIKVWTSDGMRTDFDWINAPYYKNGDVWNTDISISPNENYEQLAEWFLSVYAPMLAIEISKDGLIKEE